MAVKNFLWLLGATRAIAALIPRHATPVTRQEVSSAGYDFVIAGGGVAGLTLADRLTEDPNGRKSFVLILSRLETWGRGRMSQFQSSY